MSFSKKSALGLFAVALMTTSAQALSIPTMPKVPTMPTLPTLPSMPAINAPNPVTVARPVIFVPRAHMAPWLRRGGR